MSGRHPTPGRPLVTVCRRLGPIGIVTLACLAAVAPAVAQAPESSTVPAGTPSPTPQPTPTPIPASDIPTRAADAVDVARAAVTRAAPDARLQDIQQRFFDEQARIDRLRADTTKRLSAPGPASVIKETENSWARVRERLDRWLGDLATRSGDLDTTLEDLGEAGIGIPFPQRDVHVRHSGSPPRVPSALARSSE